MPQSDTKIRKLAEARILARAQDEAAFRDLLLKDPRRAFKEEFGVALPPTLNVQVIEEPADTLILAVPARPAAAGSLSDAQLEQVSGGWYLSNAFIGGTDCGGSGGGKGQTTWLEAIAIAMGSSLDRP
jgi:hypothetical protein